MMPTSSPGATSKEMSRFAVMPPKRLVIAGDGEEAHGAGPAAGRRRSRSPIQGTRPCGAKRIITMSATP